MNKYYPVREYCGDRSCLPPAAYLYLFNPTKPKPSLLKRILHLVFSKVTTTLNK